MKECAPEIISFRTSIINRSFKSGCFPSHLQIAKVIPIYKKGDANLPENYRPISLLTIFSKIFEKIVFKRVMTFLENHSLISNCQYGFRPNYSTELAIHCLTNQIYEVLDKKQYQITVFCDLSKAFDTISHDILLQKLELYGIRGPALA